MKTEEKEEGVRWEQERKQWTEGGKEGRSEGNKGEGKGGGMKWTSKKELRTEGKK